MATAKAAATTHKCGHCGKDSNMECPTCIKLGLPSSYYCSENCFKEAWPAHKLTHKSQKELLGQLSKALEGSLQDGEYRSRSGGYKINYEQKFKNYSYTGSLRRGKILGSMRTVPDTIAQPDYANDKDGTPYSELKDKSRSEAPIKTPSEIEAIKKACRLGREVLDIAANAVKVGVTGEDIDRIVYEATLERDSYPSPLNYYNFPKSCCVSVNEVICHGIPDDRPLENGDIVNIDISLYHKGFHSDLNETFPVGTIDDDSKRLLRTAYHCLHKTMNECKPGMMYKEAGTFIEKEARENKCSVVRSYCGHGVGSLFHCAPNIPHYAKNKAIGTMKPGHVFTIEPMINLGTYQDITWPDEWTAVTADGKRSAQFEHTILITETGYENLTARTDGMNFLDKYGLN